MCSSDLADRRELYKAISKAGKPVASEIRDPAHLHGYMPQRYADVLAGDLAVTTQKRFGRDPSIAIRARGRTHKRKVIQLDEGVLSHPLFGDREHWYRQTAHVKAGFCAEPAEKAASGIPADALAATPAPAQQSAQP